MVMTIISVMGLVLLFLLKGEKRQKPVFYFMAVWGMLYFEKLREKELSRMKNVDSSR